VQQRSELAWRRPLDLAARRRLRVQHRRALPAQRDGEALHAALVADRHVEVVVVVLAHRDEAVQRHARLDEDLDDPRPHRREPSLHGGSVGGGCGHVLSFVDC
jgi:hypothetical protein